MESMDGTYHANKNNGTKEGIRKVNKVRAPQYFCDFDIQILRSFLLTGVWGVCPLLCTWLYMGIV